MQQSPPRKSHIASLLGRADNATSVDALPAKLAGLIAKYDNNRDINANFRQDIYNLLNSSIELASAMSDQTYPQEVATEHITMIMRVLTAFIAHAEKSKPIRYAYGIQHIVSGKMLPAVFNTEGEAYNYLDQHSIFPNMEKQVQVIPIKISSAYLLQPRNQTMLSPPPIPQPTDMGQSRPPDASHPLAAMDPQAPPPSSMPPIVTPTLETLAARLGNVGEPNEPLGAIPAPAFEPPSGDTTKVNP